MVNPMRLASLLALAAFPLLEIGLMFRAGQALGVWRLALIVVLTAILGSVVIRRIGLSVFTKARAEIEAGRGGVEPLLDGLLQVIAGLLLIFPGLISDAIGVVLLIPIVRQILAQRVLPRMFRTYRYEAQPAEDRFQRRGQDRHDDDRQGEGVVIEGEYERVAEKTIPPENALQPRGAASSK